MMNLRKMLRPTAAFIAMAALALSMAGCTGGQSSTDGASEDASSSPAANAGFVIIHTNDTHGSLLADDKSFGLDAVAQLKADYEAQGYDVLLVDAGDEIQGNLFVDDSQGAVIPELWNACGYDVAVLGNHEFDYGADALEELLTAYDLPVLSANITVEATGEPFCRQNAVFTLSDGTQVGVFGLTTPETMTKSDPRHTEGLAFAQGEDLYACAQAQIDELRAEGCDIVVCVGHLGELESSAPNRASDVVANTEGIDLFIDGHDHEVENAIVTDKGGNEVLIVETGSHLENIGVVTYEDGKFTASLIAADEYEGSDPEVNALTNEIAADIDERMNVVVGFAPFKLEGAESLVRTQETNLGDLAVDALRWQAAQALGTEPDCALVNGGSLRTSIDEGDITMHDLHDVYPFSNQVVVIEVTGAELLEALEAGCQSVPETMGAFPQVSGITYTVNASAAYEKGEQYPYSTYFMPANLGSRVTITDVNGKGFDLDAAYVLATTDFIAYGGDTYCCFAEATQDSVRSIGYTPYEALLYYIADGCEGVVPDEYAQAQGRITIVGAEDAEEAQAA